MNSTLMFANKRLYREANKIAESKVNHYSGAYPAIAYCQDIDKGIETTVNTHDSMDSSGGW